MYNRQIQKSYDRSRVVESFSLSFYNGQGYSYVVNRDGDILLRPNGAPEGDNIIGLLERYGTREDADRLGRGLASGTSGSVTTLSGNNVEFTCTYLPINAVDGWYLVSVVPTNAIMEESQQMLKEFQMALVFLFLVLFVCALFVLLIWRTQQDLHKKEKEVEYQTQLFDIFTTYLSGNTDDIYLILDHETDKLEHVSPNVGRVLGMDPENVVAEMRDQDMEADPEASLAYYREIRALVPGKAAASRYTERINANTGERRYFWENAYCVPIQGRIKRVCCISDRTRERKSQNDLAEALHMAQAASDAKTSFLSSVSHDIRTPMNAIIGFLALMRDEADNPDTVREYTQRIDAASQHLLGLINDVLDMNKIESGGTTLSISELNLADVVEEINTIIRPQAKAKNQTFDIFVSHLNYEYLLGDKMRINQILINLLSNAVKYTQKGGALQL
ncbi:MAG: hybrid sensor histidine kinase/response regulator, partial [Oscillospiraceae bacterium]|nr:hybrid sensor histidine kinase/response regulator [Oscillospiraceae bacterium]